MERGPIAISALAIDANVPQPRIYSIIKSLVSKGYLREITKKPAKYDAMNPGHVLRSKLYELRQGMEAELAEAEQIYETRLQTTRQSESLVWISYGKDAWTSEVMSILESARRSFIGVFRSVGWVTEDGILKLLKKVAASKTSIRIVGLGRLSSVEDLEILRDATDAEVRVIEEDSNVAPFAVIDKTRVLIALEEGVSIGQTVSLIANDSKLCAKYERDFESIWAHGVELKSL